MCSYESIKSSIRLLLTSASNGLSFEQLNADYQQYNQWKTIPFANFGYRTLFDFLCDMPDIAQFDWNSSPPIVHSVQTNRQNKLMDSTSINDYSSQTNERTKKKLTNTRSTKNVKRLILSTISTNSRQYIPSTEHIIRQLNNLTTNQTYLPKNSSENSCSTQMLTVSINSINQCRIIRSSNGKYYIPCFELCRILDLNEEMIDKETMFSRIRIYQSNDLFNVFENMNNSCQHAINSHRPYFFLFLISSIIPVLKMTTKFHQYNEVLLAFEQLLMMEIDSHKK